MQNEIKTKPKSNENVIYLSRSKNLDPNKTGFRKFNATQSAWHKLTDDISKGKDKQLAIVLLQFDFNKAFDTAEKSNLEWSSSVQHSIIKAFTCWKSMINKGSQTLFSTIFLFN